MLSSGFFSLNLSWASFLITPHSLTAVGEGRSSVLVPHFTNPLPGFLLITSHVLMHHLSVFKTTLEVGLLAQILYAL